MKRMKQIEQEKDVLIQGLAAVDKAREWYLKQISITQEKIQHLGRMGSHVVDLGKMINRKWSAFLGNFNNLVSFLGTMD